jgi:hypothetical protein
MNAVLERAIFLCGLAQFGILVASSLVPFRLNWKEELRCLSPLHRQMYWVYGGYVVLSIVAFGVISMLNAKEIAAGSLPARSFCGYVAAFWGIRLSLQAVFDVEEHLTARWLRLGYRALTCLFFIFTACYGYAAFHW